MAKHGAPTGKWPTTPGHISTAEGPGDPTIVKARLTVKRPNVPDVEIPLEKPDFYIGRHPNEVDLTLDDELVSKRHARLSVDAKGYFMLVDIGSRNGIKYAGRTVRRLNLVDGDQFAIGKTEFVFHADMPRFKPKVEPPPRKDSLAVDISIPIPEPEASVSEVAEPEASPAAAPASGEGSPE